MKTININDDLHDKLKEISDNYGIGINNIVDILTRKSIKLIPGEQSLPGREINIDKYKSIMQEKGKPIPDFIINRYFDRAKDDGFKTPRECASDLFSMMLDGIVERSDNELYSLTEGDPI